MTAASTIAPARHEPELLGQTVVVIGGSAGIGLETARRPGSPAPPVSGLVSFAHDPSTV